jgi:hypothetical protein
LKTLLFIVVDALGRIFNALDAWRIVWENGGIGAGEEAAQSPDNLVVRRTIGAVTNNVQFP